MAGPRSRGPADADAAQDDSPDGLPPLTDDVADPTASLEEPLEPLPVAEPPSVVAEPVPAVAGPDEVDGPEVPEGHVLVVVAPQRSLTVPVKIGERYEGDKLVDVIGHRTARAGEMVAIRQDEVADLRALGFVQHGAMLTPPVLHQDGRVVGPTINGRPGGMLQFGQD